MSRLRNTARKVIKRARGALVHRRERRTSPAQQNAANNALRDLQKEIAAWGRVEKPWDAVRISILAGMEPKLAAAQLGEWGKRHGIKIGFVARAVDVGNSRHEVTL
jgi:hypothetical protein